MSDPQGSRKRICAGNWKMFKTPDETRAFLNEMSGQSAPTQSTAGQSSNVKKEMVIFPPAYNLMVFSERSNSLKFKYGPQNIYFENEGAFTGETSPLAAKALGSTYALIGHSERRTLFGETDELVSKKVSAALSVKLTPMLCVGETLAEREAGKTNDVLTRQVILGLSKIDKGLVTPVEPKGDYATAKKVVSPFVIAYEPVWAIGTGQVATPEQAESAHEFIRKTLKELMGEDVASSTSILYGGSVKPENASGIAIQRHIDGFLVGGASLKPKDFLIIAGVL